MLVHANIFARPESTRGCLLEVIQLVHVPGMHTDIIITIVRLTISFLIEFYEMTQQKKEKVKNTKRSSWKGS